MCIWFVHIELVGSDAFLYSIAAVARHTGVPAVQPATLGAHLLQVCLELIQPTLNETVRRWVFNSRPGLPPLVPGVYLGPDARAAAATIELLLSTARQRDLSQCCA